MTTHTHDNTATDSNTCSCARNFYDTRTATQDGQVYEILVHRHDCDEGHGGRDA